MTTAEFVVKIINKSARLVSENNDRWVVCWDDYGPDGPGADWNHFRTEAVDHPQKAWNAALRILDRRKREQDRRAAK